MYDQQGSSYNPFHHGTSTDLLKPKAASAAKPAVPSTPAASVSTSTPAPPAAPQANVPAPVIQPSTPTPAQANTTTPPAGESSFGDPSAFVVGSRNDAAVREMEAMGFARSEIDVALRAAFFNPDRAIEYLLSGIPDEARVNRAPATAAAGAAPASPPAAQPAQPAPTGGDEPVNLFEAAAQAGRGGARTGVGATGGAAGATAGGQGQAMNLEYLRQSPQFQQLRQLVQQQPAMLEPILQQVAENNPQLAQMISLNPDQFLQLLAEVRTLSIHFPLMRSLVNIGHRTT